MKALHSSEGSHLLLAGGTGVGAYSEAVNSSKISIGEKMLDKKMLLTTSSEIPNMKIWGPGK